MKPKIHTFILLLFGVSSMAQVPHEDSLNYMLDTISDPTEKIYFCMEQGNKYEDTDLFSYEYWYNKGIAIANKTDNQDMLVMLYAFLSTEYNARGNYEKQAEFIHQGKQYLSDETPFKHRRAIMAAEADYYLKVENLDAAIEINLDIIRLAKETGDSSALAATLHNIGISYYYMNEIEKSDSLIREALKINELIGNERYLINNLAMLANIQGKLGNFEKELEYNLEAKQRYIKINDVSGITFINSNIAGTYWELGNKKLAYQYLDTSLTYAKKYELKEWEWLTYKRYANYYEEDKDYKKALEFYKLFAETKANSINEQSSTKLESLTSELYEKRMEILKQNEALQAEQIKVQDEKIKAQNSENEKKKIILWVLIGGLLATGWFGFFIYKRLKITNEQNKIIEEQRTEVQLAYEEIAEKNLDITASISYAKRIQNAILPDSETLSTIGDHFVLFKPRDLVSGDFYWTEKANGYTFIAVADCTGHGVPGALVSVICHNALNRAVKEFNLTEPGKILDKTREIVLEQFNKSSEHVKDGMDIALCAIKDNQLSFSGAHNPLWIVRNSELTETKADKQPVGSYHNYDPFTTHEIQLQSGDHIYLFSDGFADQFGGEKGKKFKSKSFAALVKTLFGLSMSEQGKMLDEAFEVWKSDFEQLDDVCVFGLRV